MTTNSAPTCPGQEETVFLYLDDELPPAERVAFKHHLTTCPACQRVLDHSELLFVDIESIAPLTVPEAAVSAATTQIMARLPQPHRAQQFSSWVLLLLAGQMAVGLTLLLVTLPRLVAPYQTMLGTLARAETTLWLANIRFWAASFADLTSVWLIGQWRQVVDFPLLNISPQMALVALAGFGMAWLLSNGLLLRRQAASMRNGGTS